MTENMTVRWGATLPISVTNDDEDADEATITISLDDSVVITKTGTFVDGVADLTLSDTDTQVTPGIYDYMLKVTYDDGTVEKYPERDDCTDCELPTIEICDTNDNPEVS